VVLKQRRLPAVSAETGCFSWADIISGICSVGREPMSGNNDLHQLEQECTVLPVMRISWSTDDDDSLESEALLNFKQIFNLISETNL
jgi:hypothetical protein